MFAPAMAECKEIIYGSKEYKATVALRNELLRKPLGLKFSKAQLAREKDDFHLAAFEERELLGCMILTLCGPNEVQMRQVAVLEKLQKKGLGKELVAFGEDFARKKGYKKMVLHARDVAVPFYLKLGYRVVGEPFIEVNIPHRYMEKVL